MNLKDLLKLAGEQGKVVVVDELGEVKGIFMTYEAYGQMQGSVVQATPKETEPESERINRAILEAQLKDETTPPTLSPESHTLSQPAERLDTLLSKRAQQLFRSMPYKSERPINDMRSEVIDPNYDFNAPETSNDDEVIRPNFDDI
jgi:hypothetical protein